VVGGNKGPYLGSLLSLVNKEEPAWPAQAPVTECEGPALRTSRQQNSWHRADCSAGDGAVWNQAKLYGIEEPEGSEGAIQRNIVRPSLASVICDVCSFIRFARWSVTHRFVCFDNV
jgi:hypothetical protein